MKIICSRKPKRFVKASSSRKHRIMSASTFKRKFTVKASKSAVYSDYDYKGISYYGLDYKGIEDSIDTDDYSELEAFAWEKLMNGCTVKLTNEESGEYVRLSPAMDEGDAESIDDFVEVNKNKGKTVAEVLTQFPDYCKNIESSTNSKRKFTVKASKHSKRRKIMASYPYTKWVFDSDDGQWKMWGGANTPTVDDDFLDKINHPNYPNPEYNVENNYTDVVVLPAGETPDDGRPVKANSCTSAKNIYAEDEYFDENNARFEREQFAERVVHEIEDEYSIKISDNAWGMIMNLAADLSFGADAHKHGSDPMWVLEDTIYDIIEEDTGVVIGSSKVSRNVVTAAQADTTVSQEDVDELVFYITNDGDLYRKIATPIIENVKRKRKNGDYDDNLAVKGWQPLADEGVRRYDRECGSGKGLLSWLNKATRIAIAEELKDYYEEEISYDNSVNSFSDISAGVDTNKLSPRRFNTAKDNDLEYLTAIADGAANDFNSNYGDVGELTYDISKSAITFSLDGNIVYIQPINQIKVNWNDMNEDIEELYGMIWSEVMPRF